MPSCSPGPFISRLVVDMTVMLPSYVVWPLPTEMDRLDASERLLLPELKGACMDFERFYRDKWSKRRINWLHHLARVTMAYRLGEREYELVVTLPQANLLQRFTDRDEIAVAELLSEMKISRLELQNVVKALVVAGLLRVNSNGIVGDASIQLVTSWESKRSRIRLCHYSLGSSIDTDEDVPDVAVEGSDLAPDLQAMAIEDTSQELSESKKYFLQAITVKLLKTHQELSPARLFQVVTEVASRPGAHRFTPTDVHINAAVDQLAEKQYLEFDKRRDLYVYLP